MDDNVSLIQRYREQAGLNQSQLGKKIGVTRQTIAAWEKADREPSILQLSRIATTLGVPLDLLIGLETNEEVTLLFRADNPTVLSLQLRSLLSEKAQAYAAIEHLAGELPVLPESRPLDDYDSYLVEQVARETRDWLGVENAPLGDVLALLENKGLKIIYYPLPNEVSGFSAYTDTWGGVIVVNTNHALERQYFTCLHELAHLVFHRSEYARPAGQVKKRGDPREKAANHFASAVLLTREAMEKELRPFSSKWIPNPVLKHMKYRYLVSVRTVLFRAAELNLISRKQAGQQVGIINKEWGKEDEPYPLTLPSKDKSATGRLERLTYTALLEDKITSSRAAEILGTRLSDVRSQLADYLRPPDEGHA
jgi:Zn-dependent peptidase ImmA (M78 family)/DNA-binding XRE family transcriptional regulator